MVSDSPGTPKNADASVVLAGIRERHNAMLERERKRKRRIAAACRPFARARAAVDSAEAAYQKAKEDLERRRLAAESARDDKVARQRRVMAAAVQAIRQEDIPATEVAGLLGLSQSELRELAQLHGGGSNTGAVSEPKRSGRAAPCQPETEVAESPVATGERQVIQPMSSPATGAAEAD